MAGRGEDGEQEQRRLGQLAFGAREEEEDEAFEEEEEQLRRQRRRLQAMGAREGPALGGHPWQHQQHQQDGSDLHRQGFPAPAPRMEHHNQVLRLREQRQEMRRQEQEMQQQQRLLQQLQLQQLQLQERVRRHQHHDPRQPPVGASSSSSSSASASAAAALQMSWPYAAAWSSVSPEPIAPRAQYGGQTGDWQALRSSMTGAASAAAEPATHDDSAAAAAAERDEAERSDGEPRGGPKRLVSSEEQLQQLLIPQRVAALTAAAVASCSGGSGASDIDDGDDGGLSTMGYVPQTIASSALARAHASGSDLSVKDAHWFLDALEEYHLSKLSAGDRATMDDSNLRSKPKHRNAVLFHDDHQFVLRYPSKVEFSESAFENSGVSDPRVYLIQESGKCVLLAYKLSLLHAPAKSCIWSALLCRTAYHLQRSGFENVQIVDQVEGVQHKEATLFFNDYHISRSNFTKVCRALLNRVRKDRERQRQREAAQRAVAGDG